MENGKGAIVPKLPHVHAFGSTEFHVLRPGVAIADKWLAYYLSQPDFRRIARQNMTGTAGQLRVPATWLSATGVPLPPRAEQARIVEKLEELLSDLDAGVGELKTALRKLAQYRQSLLRAAVEGVLTTDWRGNVPASGELPEGWEWTTIGALGKVQLGRQRSPEKLKGINPTKYIRAANITENGIDFDDVLEMDFSETERATFALKQNDVLLTEASGSAEHVGRPVIWPAVEGLYCFQNTVLRFVPNGISAEFAFYSFLAMQKIGVFRRMSAGVGINHLSAGKFSKLPFALPPEEEQRQIIALLETQLEAVREQQAAIERGLAQAAAQRKNILKTAFTGQLVPQDPNDEPASELLARIRVERARNDGSAPHRRRKTT